MRRALLSLFAFAALAMWAGAQGPAPLPAATQVKQFKTNRILIENLVDHGIDLSNAESPLQRAEACRRTAGMLANYVKRAADEEDADRVAEFTGLFSAVIRDGLVPNLDQAKKNIEPGSPDSKRFKDISTAARNDLDGVRNSIPTHGKLGESEKIKGVLRVLGTLSLQQ